MKKSRNRFSSLEKVNILKSHLLENKSVSDICDEYKIHPTLYYKWQKSFFENGFLAFDKQRKNDQKNNEQKIQEFEKKIEQKNSVIAELMEEHIKVKKSLGEA